MVTKFEEVDAVLKRAQNGDADAQFELGKLFSEGKIIVQNYDSAFYWFTKACEQNHAKAFQYLGNCYLCGEGVQIDKEKAVECFKRSGELGCPAGFYNLGFTYFNGLGTSVDCDKALYYLDKAGQMGESDGFTGAGIVCLHRKDGKKNPLQACDYFCEALNRNPNDATAIFKLGELYAYGIVAKKDNEMAKKLFERSAELGDADAKQALIDLKNGKYD